MGNNPRSPINLLSDKNIVFKNEAEGGYNYYGYVSKTGAWAILREKLDGTEYLYAVGSKDFDTNYAARVGQSYQEPSAYPAA